MHFIVCSWQLKQMPIWAVELLFVHFYIDLGLSQSFYNFEKTLSLAYQSSSKKGT